MQGGRAGLGRIDGHVDQHLVAAHLGAEGLGQRRPGRLGVDEEGGHGQHHHGEDRLGADRPPEPADGLLVGGSVGGRPGPERQPTGGGDPVAGLDVAPADEAEAHQESEERDLDDEQLAVGRLGECRRAPHLPPALEDAGDQDGDDRAERDPGEAGDDGRQLVGKAPGQHGRRQQCQASEPEADGAQVDEVGDDRQRDQILRRFVPGQGRGEQEPEPDDPAGGQQRPGPPAARRRGARP